MKSATIVSTLAPFATKADSSKNDATPRVTAQVVGDDNVTRTYTDVGPAPIGNAAMLWNFLAAYDAAFVAGQAPVTQTPVAPGPLTPPTGA